MRKAVFISLAFLHLVMIVVIGLNISPIRQILTFLYLSFAPGFCLFQLLRLKEAKIVDIFILSAGLSFAFLLFLGLVINTVFPLFGFSNPLSTIPVLGAFTAATLAILFFVNRRGDAEEPTSNVLNSTQLRGELVSILLFIPAILCILGTIYFTPVLLFGIAAIALIIALSGFSPQLVPIRSYHLMVYAISVALVFQLPMVSKHLMGFDSPAEYLVFRVTNANEHWNPFNAALTEQAAINFNSMLSITILPEVYSALMNINGEILFKLLYPFILSLVPVTLYRTYESQFGKLPALFSVLFFVSSSSVFYGVEPLSLNRQLVALFFIALSIFVSFNTSISLGKRRFLLIIFGAAIAVSHYSLMYIYLAYLFFVYLFLRIKKFSNVTLNAATLGSIVAIAFSWNILVSPSTIKGAVSAVENIFSNFQSDLYNPAARASDIFKPHSILTGASLFNWMLFITAHFFIVIGILILILKPRKVRINLEFRLATLFGAVVLLLCFAIPNLAPSLNFSRFYAISLVFLAPCFAVGGETILTLVEKLWIRPNIKMKLPKKERTTGKLLVAIILCAYFLSQSGFINSITSAAPQSYVLDGNRIQKSNDYRLKISYYTAYNPEQDVISALWLSQKIDNSVNIYSDFVSRDHPLYCYGEIDSQQLNLLTNNRTSPNSIVYLRLFNVVDGVFTPSPTEAWYTAEISGLLNNSNEIYSNGASEIYQSPTGNE